jgi:hypothetical protein
MSWSDRTHQWLDMAAARQHCEVYSRFAMQFIAFNAFYSEVGAGGDEASSTSWIDDQRFTISAEQLLVLFQSEHVGFFLDRTPSDGQGHDLDAAILDLRHWLDSAYPLIPSRRHNGVVLPKYPLIRRNLGGTPLSKEHLKQLVGVVYQVRCNLFHGGKTPTNEVNVQVVNNASLVLDEVMRVALPQFN